MFLITSLDVASYSWTTARLQKWTQKSSSAASDDCLEQTACESVHFRGIDKSFQFIDYFLKRRIYPIQLKIKILVPFHPKK